MKRKNSILRICAALSGAVLLASNAELAVFAESMQRAEVYTGNGFEVSYRVTNHWADTYQCEMMITNTGSKTIHDWCLAYVSNQDFDQIWNCTAESSQGIMMLHNAGYNQDILAGETVSIGFVQITDEFEMPQKYVLLGEPDVLPSSAYETEFSILEDWEGGYTAALTVTNLSDHLIEDWSLEFDWDHAVNSVWNGEMTAHDGDHYTVGNAGYNQNIEAGESVTVCLQCGSSFAEAAEISNVVLTEYGASRRKAINDLFNTRNLTIDLSGLVYNPEGYYFVDDVMDKIRGTITPELLAVDAHYTIENSWGIELFSGEFTPAANWEIPDIGFVIGLNKLSLEVTFNDNTIATMTVWFGNFNEENMRNVPIDQTDPDADGLINYLEDLYGTDPELADTDGDGINDYLELTDIGTNPLLVDTDENGVPDGEEDPDKDSIGTAEEIRTGTDPRCIDTDNDGLKDGEEISEYETDPLNADTDGDGAEDGWEVHNGYDPLTADDFSVAEQTVEGDTNSAEITVTTADGSARTLSVTPLLDDTTLNSSMTGYMGCGFDFEMDGEFTSAVLKITFDESYLEEDGLTPVIYYYNEETGEVEEIETEWDGVSNYVTASLPHFSTYILLNKKSIEEAYAFIAELNSRGLDEAYEFVLAIDASGSMGTNDPSNERLSVAKTFVSNFSDNDLAAVFSFGQYNTVLSGFTSDKQQLKDAIDLVKHNESRTNIGAAITKGLSFFGEQNGSMRYLIILTDGISHDSLPSDYVETCREKGVQIITIAFGQNMDQNYLKDVAKATDPSGGDGMGYTSSSASGLTGIFSDITKKTVKEDPFKDSNNDGITDVQTRAFCDYTLTTLYGEHPFAGYTYEQIQADTDGDLDDDGLLNGEEIQIPSKEADSSLMIFILTDPRIADTDGDGINDGKERKNGTSPTRPDFDKEDVDFLLDDDNDYFMASMMSEEYLDSKWLKFKLFAGNFLFGGFNIDYVDDYEEQLTSLIYVMSQKMAEQDSMLIMQESVHDDFKRISGDLYTIASVVNKRGLKDEGLSNLLKNIGSYTDDLALADVRIQTLKNLKDVDAVKDEYLVLRAKLDAAKITADINKCEALKELDNIAKYDKGRMQKNFGKFVSKAPAKLKKAMRFMENVGTVIDVVTVTIQTGSEIEKDVTGISYLCSGQVEYGKTMELLDAIIDYSDNSDMRTAAKNLKSAMTDEGGEYLLKIGRVLGDVSKGTMQFERDYLLAESGPLGCAILMGVAIGDILFNTGNVDAQSLATISMGDTGESYAAYVKSLLSSDTSKYYTLSEEDSYVLSVLAQTRVVGENEFNDTAQDFSWLYDKFAHIKQATKEAAEWNIKRIREFADSSSLVDCETAYKGASVPVE